jgi:hypothetical protein
MYLLKSGIQERKGLFFNLKLKGRSADNTIICIQIEKQRQRWGKQVLLP